MLAPVTVDAFNLNNETKTEDHSKERISKQDSTNNAQYFDFLPKLSNPNEGKFKTINIFTSKKEIDHRVKIESIHKANYWHMNAIARNRGRPVHLGTETCRRARNSRRGGAQRPCDAPLNRRPGASREWRVQSSKTSTLCPLTASPTSPLHRRSAS